MDQKSNALAIVLSLALCVISPSQAAFKVLEPDGKVTYTDRLPNTTVGKVTPISATGGAVTDTSLPLELRQPASRYPATLFVMANCAPCDSARTLLRERGIPYTEKSVSTEEDADALMRLTGSRDAPTLMLGTQPLRGLSPELWNNYLDLAGYPRESRLSADYQWPLPTPLTRRHKPSPSGTLPATARKKPETETRAPDAGSSSTDFKF